MERCSLISACAWLCHRYHFCWSVVVLCLQKKGHFPIGANTETDKSDVHGRVRTTQCRRLPTTVYVCIIIIHVALSMSVVQRTSPSRLHLSTQPAVWDENRPQCTMQHYRGSPVWSQTSRMKWQDWQLRGLYPVTVLQPAFCRTNQLFIISHVQSIQKRLIS